MDFKSEEHKSFGVIKWARVQGTAKDLFGSSLEHHNFINLEICEASITRELNRDWIHGNNPIVSIDMSPNQFAEFITSPNQGSGVPCTIRYTKSEGMIEGKPIISKRKQFQDEFRDDMVKISHNFDSLESAVANLQKGKVLTVKDKQAIESAVFEVRRIIQHTLPFVQTSFNEQIDNTVTEAKASIEAFMEEKIRSTGLSAIKNNLKFIEEASND